MRATLRNQTRLSFSKHLCNNLIKICTDENCCFETILFRLPRSVNDSDLKRSTRSGCPGLVFYWPTPCHFKRPVPENTRYLNSVILLLAYCLRRWPNIKKHWLNVSCMLFGLIMVSHIITWYCRGGACWQVTLGHAGPTSVKSVQHLPNVLPLMDESLGYSPLLKCSSSNPCSPETSPSPSNPVLIITYNFY